MTGWPRPYEAPKTLEQESAEFHQQELDWWDERFKTETGAYPTFSRLFPVFDTHGLREVGGIFKRCASRPMGLHCTRSAEPGMMYCGECRKHIKKYIRMQGPGPR